MKTRKITSYPCYVCHATPYYQNWIYRINKDRTTDRREKNFDTHDFYRESLNYYVTAETLLKEVDRGTYKIISKQEANELCKSWRKHYAISW